MENPIQDIPVDIEFDLHSSDCSDEVGGFQPTNYEINAASTQTEPTAASTQAGNQGLSTEPISVVVENDETRKRTSTAKVWEHVTRFKANDEYPMAKYDEWRLHKRISSFYPITSHKGESIGKTLEKCVKDFGIEKVMAVTVDNAIANDMGVRHLKNFFVSKKTALVDGKYMHMRCVAHILNLIVGDDLKEKEYQTCVSIIREAVKFARASNARLAKFLECAKTEGIEESVVLSLDVPTRHELRGVGLPEKSDWENARALCVFLKRFYILTCKVSAVKSITSTNLLDEIWGVHKTLLQLQNHSESAFRSMAREMYEKYDKYWGQIDKTNMLVYVSAVIDPRKKLKFVTFCIQSMYATDKASSLLAGINEALKDIFEDYVKVLNPAATSSQSSQVQQSSLMEEDDDYDAMAEFQKHQMESGGDELKTELYIYLQEEPEVQKKDGDFDVLIWWKLNSPRFPILSSLAKDVLAIPVSTVASESTFSTGGRVFDPYRSSLTPKLVQALICAQDWLKVSKEYDPAAETEEQKEMDKLGLDLKNIFLDTNIDT
ncbi:hypothetical protein CCACVL1_04732 [Corchorus capsularis]|uniref:HAT C-terminal dimerisation domain-containing protein n=1 Tax=Corchorus capsularis TaxID=210143 RepID=A0A1R3JQ88_COCAP|nr:hypothetical protein CCACVL1_04732 [Corchorus capsularis]